MHNPTFTIRRADESDVTSLAVLMNTLGYPTTVEDMAERFSNILLLPNYQTLVACYTSEVKGMIGASYHYFYEQNGIYVRITALVTLQTHRRMGIAQALLEAVESWAREIKATCILLNCGNREERKVAHDFYSRRGFEKKSIGYIKEL
jgi:GNAT superfamily N-acetyltransferase